MATSSAAILMLTLYWVFNHSSAHDRLRKIKWLSFLFDPKKAILARINLGILFAAGFGLSAWLSGFVSFINFPIFGLGIRLFTVLMLAGVVLFLVDCLDGGGIKNSSYFISFGMPVVAASSGGAIATFILALSGAINHWASSLLATLVA